jgi:hypothetical protein
MGHYGQTRPPGKPFLERNWGRMRRALLGGAPAPILVCLRQTRRVRRLTSCALGQTRAPGKPLRQTSCVSSFAHLSATTPKTFVAQNLAKRPKTLNPNACLAANRRAERRRGAKDRLDRLDDRLDARRAAASKQVVGLNAVRRRLVHRALQPAIERAPDGQTSSRLPAC